MQTPSAMTLLFLVLLVPSTQVVQNCQTWMCFRPVDANKHCHLSPDLGGAFQRLRTVEMEMLTSP